MLSDLLFFFFIPIWRWLVNYLHDLFTVQCMCCHTGLSMPLSKGMPSVLLQLTAQTLPQMLPLLVWRAWQKKKSTSCQTQVGIGHSDPAHMGGIYTAAAFIAASSTFPASSCGLHAVYNPHVSTCSCVPSLCSPGHVYPAYALQDTATGSAGLNVLYVDLS